MTDSKTLHADRLQKAITEAVSFREQDVSTSTPGFMDWRNRVIQSLEVLGGPSNSYEQRFKALIFEEGRSDLDPRFWGHQDNTFKESFSLAEKLIGDALEEFGAHSFATQSPVEQIITPPSASNIRELNQAAVPIEEIRDLRNVFVVHGRNEKIREDFFNFLRALGLHPIEWAEALRTTGKATPFVGEVLDAAFERAQAVIVLLTPDDEVRLGKELWAAEEGEDERQYRRQARPNVLFEAGMAFGRNPDQTLLVTVGPVKQFSDIGGRHIVRLSNDTARRQDIADRLKTAGCSVNIDGRDWLKTGNFEMNPAQIAKAEPESSSKLTHEEKEMLDELWMHESGDKQIVQRIEGSKVGTITLLIEKEFLHKDLFIFAGNWVMPKRITGRSLFTEKYLASREKP